MYTYALRCVESDYDDLIALGTFLGVLETVTDDEGTSHIVAKENGTFDFIGYKPDQDTGVTQVVEGIEVKVGQLPQGLNGDPYVHANLRTPINIRERAEAMAQANPGIAEGLANIGKYFITDAEGNATLPEYPLRVFA